MRARCSSGSTPVRRGGGSRTPSPAGGEGGGAAGAGGGGDKDRVPRREEADRRGGVGVGQRCARGVEQLVSRLGAEAPQLEPIDGGGELARLQAGEGRDVVAGGRPERVEVALDQVLD